MIIFFTLLELILVGLRVAASYFSESIPFFAVAAAPLTWACVIVFIIDGLFIAAKLYKGFRREKPPKE